MKPYKEKINNNKWILGFDIGNEPDKHYRWEISSPDIMSDEIIDRVIEIRYENYLRYHATL